jgi:hypothetical protein
MMGIKQRTFKIHPNTCLEALLPEDHFYRQLEAKLDLSFVRDLVAYLYSPCGRASIDPGSFSNCSSLCFSKASALSVS